MFCDHILMFLVMICTLMVLIAQNITETDEIKNIIKNAEQNMFAVQNINRSFPPKMFVLLFIY